MRVPRVRVHVLDTPGHSIRSLGRALRRRLVPVGVTLLALLSGCASGSGPIVSLPAGPAIINVVEQDLDYVLDHQGEIPAGRAVLRIRNRSRLSHDLSLVALPEDVPPINEQLRSPGRRAVTTLARLPSRPPGSTDAFAVDLAPGRYALLCFEQDGTGGTHALKGMAVEFRVSSSRGERDGG